MIRRYYLHCDEVFPNAISGIVISYESYRATEQKNYMHSRGTSPRKIVTKRNCVDKILSDPMAMANDWRARSEAWFMGRLRETSVSYICMYMHTRMQVLLPIVGIHEGKLSQNAIPLSLHFRGKVLLAISPQYDTYYCVESIDGRINRSIVIGRTRYVDSI